MRPESDLRETQNIIIDALVDAQQQMVVAGMGAGKTVAYLTAFKRLQDEGFLRKGIILAPPKVVDLVWPRECRKWEHLQDVKVLPIRGTVKQRLKLLKQDADLYAVSLFSLKWLADVVAKWSPDDPRLDLCGIDEISKLRDPRSKNSAYAFKNGLWNAFNTIWGATGTIKPNGYEDLWQTYRVISQGAIWKGEPFDEWRRQRFMPLDTKGYKWRIHSFTKKEVDRRVAHFTTAVIADLDLPPLNKGEDFDITVPMHPDAEEAYTDMVKDMLVEVDYDGYGHLDREQIAALTAAVQSGKLAQIAQGFIMDKRVDETGEKMTSQVIARFGNAKLETLKEQLETLHEEGENVIVCYYYKEDLRVLQEAFKGAGHLGAGVTPRQAERTVDKWNEGRMPLLLCHPGSVSHGIELQFGGRWMIWYTPTWSSEQFDQMIMRISRPGQTKPVFISRLLAEDTVDQIKVNRVEGKLDDQKIFDHMLKRWTDDKRRS